MIRQPPKVIPIKCHDTDILLRTLVRTLKGKTVIDAEWQETVLGQAGNPVTVLVLKFQDGTILDVWGDSRGDSSPHVIITN